MREINGASKLMITADQAREEIRSPLALLLQHHVSRGTPRMDAYARVASLVGRSPAWVQRVIGRRPDTVVGWHDALNIRAAYERLCTRVEAAADAEEARIATLTEELHAARSARHPLGPPTPAAPLGGAAGSRRPVRPSVPALAPAHARSRAPRVPVDLTDLPLWQAAHQEK